MREGIVKKIKQYHPFMVKNAMWRLGWGWKNPKRAPTNIEVMLIGVPKPALIEILAILES